MFRPLILSLMFATSAAQAGAPKVVTDIAPVHSLVAQVMGDLGTPDLLIAPGTSPHHYSMRPSEAAALQEAEIVIWIGEGLTPQLGRSIEALGTKANVISLLEAPGMHLLEYRELDEFNAQEHGEDAHDHDGHEGHDDHAEHKDHDDHGHDEHAHDDHAHEDHAEHKGHDDHGHDDHASHDEHAAHDDHGHKDDHGHHHHEGGIDPHLWLDPENAQAALQVIAAALAEKDPANAGTYKANAKSAAEALGALDAGLKTRLAALGDRNFLVYHDAFQYFEKRYGISASGSIAVGDAQAPGPARLQRVREILLESGAVCVFSEPQLSEKLVVVVTEGTDVKGSVIDPLGAELTLGANLYPALLEQIAESMEGCLAPGA